MVALMGTRRAVAAGCVLAFVLVALAASGGGDDEAQPRRRLQMGPALGPKERKGKAPRVKAPRERGPGREVAERTVAEERAEREAYEQEAARQLRQGKKAPSPPEVLAPENIRKWATGRGKEKSTFRIEGRRNTSDTLAATAYRPAANERVWLDGARRGRICDTAELPEVEAAARQWMSYATRAFWATAGEHAPRATPEERSALSHFHYGRWGTEHHYVEPIEPLSGIGRHPFAKVGCPHSAKHPHNHDKFDITYLILHNNCGRGRAKPRTLLFDLGASVGFQGVPGGVYETLPRNPTRQGGIATASLPLFYRLYADRCLEPDVIFAWEPNPKVSGPDWWGELPGRIRAKVHFYNDFVDEGELSQAKGDGAHPARSFLEILEAEVKEDDFVVVKLDIDAPLAELAIVEAIADRPEIAARIDELYFEYHYYFDGYDFGWHGEGTAQAHKGLGTQGDVDTALGLMHRLRELGIRAHFWI